MGPLFRRIYTPSRGHYPAASPEAHGEDAVAAILGAVKARGDEAVLEHTQRFDGIAAASMAELEMPRQRLDEAFAFRARSARRSRRRRCASAAS